MRTIAHAGSRDPAEAFAGPAPRPRLMLAILVALSALSQADRGIISLLVDPITQRFAIDYFQFSLLQGSAFALFYATFGLPCGAIADRRSRRGLIFGGVIVWSLATVACGMAASFHQILAARFFVGAGEAALYPAALSLISDVFPRRRLAGAIAMFSIGTSIGAGVSLGLGGFLLRFWAAHPIALPILGALAPWQALLVTLGALGLPLAFLVLLIPEPRRTGPHAAGASWRALAAFIGARRGFFAAHFIGFTLLGLLANASGGWIPQVLMRRYGFTPAVAGLSFGLIAAGANVTGMLAAGRILDRLIGRGVGDAPFRLFLWVTPVTACLTIAGFLSHNAALFLACVALAQFGFSIAGPAATAIQLVAPSEMRGRIASLFSLVFNLVSISAGPASVAWLTTYVLHDPARVNVAVAITFAIVAPVAWLILHAGLGSMRAAMRQADAAAAADPPPPA